MHIGETRQNTNSSKKCCTLGGRTFGARGVDVFYDKVYYCYGFIGAFWGIIAGLIGIRMSYSNNLSQTKCLWRAYILLIFMTMFGSAAGFVVGILHLLDNTLFPEVSYSFFTAVSCIEIIFLFGKVSCFNYRIIIKHL